MRSSPPVRTCLASLALLVAIGGPARGQEERPPVPDYAGTFHAEPDQEAALGLELVRAAGASEVSGYYLDPLGNKLTLTAAVDPSGALNGEIRTARGVFEFSARQDGELLELVLLSRSGDLRQFRLRRVRLPRVEEAPEQVDLIGTYEVGEVQLVLEESPHDPDALVGRLRVGGREFPLAARRHGAPDGLPAARGTYRVGEREYGFLVTLDDPEELILRADNGNVYRLRRHHGLHRRAPRFRHPEGLYGLDLPPGWTVEGHAEGVTAVNPGLAEGEQVSGQILIHHGYVRLQEEGQAAQALLDRHAQDHLRALLDQQGIALQGATDAQALDLTGADDAARLEATGRAGDQEVRVAWYLAVAHGSTVSLLVTALADDADRYLAPCVAAFESLVIYPRQRDPEREAALVGRSFTCAEVTQAPPAAPDQLEYEFRPGNQVVFRRSGRPDQPLHAEEGRYEVVEDVVLLVFEDRVELPGLILEAGRVTGLAFEEVEFR
jgi:hypothetical protein